ncbi:response regulator transcription factor NblR [Merismopedia glauca]|uniref:response regulator transcription factor NblR n=1 Tax=Merismopedia glauca TaxID=292586 RepID=UPI0015E68991|nr:response regulator transcription factor [Merismopedia glauca]
MSANISDNHNLCVLVVESDTALAATIGNDLQTAGFNPVLAYNLQDAWQQATQHHPALVIIDRTISTSSGLDLCNQLRRGGYRQPILILVSRDTVEDRVACLDAGADDYFLKPYRSDVFLQRIHLYLPPKAVKNEQLQFGELILDLATRRALRNGREIDLTMKEFELLRYLMSHPRETLTREQILENVWGYEFMGASNVIEVYVRYLRLKIEDEGEKRLIQTVRGVGYVLREN